MLPTVLDQRVELGVLVDQHTSHSPSKTRDVSNCKRLARGRGKPRVSRELNDPGLPLSRQFGQKLRLVESLIGTL